MNNIIFNNNTSSFIEIRDHLLDCSGSYTPPLFERVDIDQYAKKISDFAIKFEAWYGGKLIGLLAMYCDKSFSGKSFITNVSVLSNFRKNGVASKLIDLSIEYASDENLNTVQLEVDYNNLQAVSIYKNKGFLEKEMKGSILLMEINMLNDKNIRNYDEEIRDSSDHQYAYNFDFDVMHHYMIESFKHFFINGSILELGCFKGDFTKRLIPFSNDITCVEASKIAVDEAKERLNENILFVNETFENVSLPKKYENIILTHVLEHLDDPASLLRRINDEWLADNGRLFLVCPNANAPSRQIAVKMGLLSHNAGITVAEKEHGHRRTYSFDTIESDVASSGLSVIARQGIFFKAFANFQWDRLLATDIITSEYLDGCFMLGQQYPDLCASIFLLCGKR